MTDNWILLNIMKLSKLYSNDSRFKNIEFNLLGLNVIYADVISEPSEKKNSHDLGKTKLAELIDYLFMKQLSQSSFLLKIKNSKGQSLFYNHVFYLELLLNSGKFLTIRRGIANNPKASFALNDQRTKGFVSPVEWDYEDISFKESKKVLSNYLMLDFFHSKPYDFRKAINYSIRMQQDYEDVYKLSKYKQGKDVDWKPFMFDLLGFDGRVLEAKYKNDSEQETIKQYIIKLKNEFAIKVEDRDDIVAQLKLKEDKAKDVENQIDSFNFYEQDKILISNGIEKVEKQISELNSLSYQLNYEITRLQQSIKNKFAFNMEKVNRVFEESNIYFSENLKQDYDALINFNKSLTLERNKLLQETLKKKQSELQTTNIQLQQLNERKESLLSYLKDTDSFRRFKLFQKELVKIESEILQVRQRLQHIDLILEKEKERERLKKQIEETIDQLKDIHQRTEDNVRYNTIRGLFSKYFKAIMDEDSYISWTLNTENNVEFKPPKVRTKDDQTKDTAKDEGRTYRKMLCVAFDLAILAAYNIESYFRFVYHDDVLSQQDNGIKLRLLELINSLSHQFNLQYILSVIKSDLPTDSNDLPVYFSPKEIILNLHDRDESGTLFGFEF